MNAERHTRVSNKTFLKSVGMTAIGCGLLVSAIVINERRSSDTPDRELIARVGTHVLLPENERPTLATVTDARKLFRESIFAEAENGDRVLAYRNARRLIIYRPSLDRIITIATTYDR